VILHVLVPAASCPRGRRPFNQLPPYDFDSVVATGALLAHQGGWDEILMLLAPVVVIAAVLAITKRRVDRHGAAGAGEHEPDPDLRS
jgi:hypothetical protein